MTHHWADEIPPGAALPAPAEALPGGPDGAGPFPPPPFPTAGGLVAAAAACDRALRASARRVADDSKSDGLPGPDGDVRGISAAGAPLAIIAAIKDGGGAAGPSASVVSEVSCPTLGGAELPETLAMPGSTDGAVGAGVDGEDRSTGAAPTGPVVDTAVVGGGVASTTDAVGPGSAAGAGASTTAGAAAGSATGGGACTTGAGSTTGVGACTTAGAGAGAGSTTGAGAGSTAGGA